MRERGERNRERAGEIKFRVLLCVSFFSLCGSGCVFARSAILIVQVVTCLVFQPKREAMAVNPKLKVPSLHLSPCLSPLLSILTPSFSPPHTLVVCRGSHGDVDPIQSNSKGGGECTAVLYNLWRALALADLGHGIGQLL